jgi:mRNA-degrading endonuclease RelE of RelBE toxin-antitoxin system
VSNDDKHLVVLYHDEVVRRDIPRLDRSIAQRIRRAIELKLTQSPESYAKPLAYTRSDLWTLRVGDWRVVFALRGDEVWVLRIGHRSEVYRGLDSLLESRD